MKKILSFLLVVVLCMAVLPIGATAFTEGDWEYSVNNGQATLTAYLGSDSEVTTPAELDGCPVTALSRTFYQNNTITKVVVSEGVESMGDFLCTFESCSNLVEVQLPQSLKALNGGVFKRCHNLTKVNLPKNLVHIGDYCFSQTAVEEFVIPASVESIALGAFVENKNLKTVIFEGFSTGFAYDTFRGCTALTKVVLPKSMKTIPQDMFSGCVSLTDITLPEDVTNISHSAFSGCASLKEIHLPQTVTNLTANAFNGCSSLETVTLSTALKEIDWHVFMDCKNLTKIMVPGRVGWMQECDLGIYKDEAGEQRVKGFTIVGFEGSVAWDFAQYHSFKFEPINSTGQFGDMDDDSKVNAKDALVTLKISVGSIIPTQAQTFAGDVNGDGSINAKDALNVLKYAVGKLESLCKGK